jgi:K+/H+ antiporter YhaU regulatory subunit KhtT
LLAVTSLLLIITLSLLITRIASVALVHTGLGREAARFQARSAFSGVGFTTREAEDVVGHPVRRRIVMGLMLVGNVGIVTAVASLMLSFLGAGSQVGPVTKIAVLTAGVVGLGWAATSQWLDRQLCRVISRALRRFTSIDVRDFARLLHLRGEYGISELRVEAEDWLAGRRLGDADLVREGILVLGVECPGGHFIGAPGPDLEIRAGDLLSLYGRAECIGELDVRTQGGGAESSRRGAVERHRAIEARERASASR